MGGVRCGGAPTYGSKHPAEHSAGTRALPSLSASLCREEAAALSVNSTPTSLSLTHKEVSATHAHTHTFSRPIME